MFSRNLLLFDLDQTLVTTTDLYRDDSFRRRVVAEITRGTKIGISTGRDLQGALPIYQHLGLNGPLIAENGGRIFVPATVATELDEVVSPENQRVTEAITALRAGLPTILGREQAGLVVVDKSPDTVGALHGSVAMVSTQRLASLSVVLYEDGQVSMALTAKVQRWLQAALAAEYPSLAVERDGQSAKLLVHCVAVTKVASALSVQVDYYKDYRVFLIGDHEATVRSTVPQLILVGVQGASEGYKELCHFTCNQVGVQGLQQILNFTREY